MPIEIKNKYYVSPRDAFEITGKESFGESWQSDCIDEPENEIHSVALENLRLALESGQVSAFWHDSDFERPLEPYEVAGEFFRINLKGNCIHLSFFAGRPIQCRINAHELSSFIQVEGKRDSKTKIGPQNACKKYLIELFTNETYPPTNEALFARCKLKFPGLSKTGFKKVKAEAIEVVGRPELKRAGRKPSHTN